jgi:hypothetical protein
MAVIRQQTQVFNKPVGVRRINTGEAELWEQVAATADEFRNRAYKKAAVDAEQAGKMKGMAAESGDIVAIDPETNQPVAFKAPSNFGSIAAASYQDIITRRFEQSVDNELKAQGSYYAKNATNADEYKNAISGHVGNMIKAGGDDTYFSRYIQEAGQSYVDSTYVAMKSKELEASILEANTNDHLRGLDAIYTIKSNIGKISTGSLHASIQKEYDSAKNLLDNNFYTIAQFESKRSELLGLQSLVNKSRLTNMYINMNENQKLKFISQIHNPSTIEDEKLKMFVIDARIDSSVETIVNGLRSIDKTAKDLSTSNIEIETSGLLSKVHSNMSYDDINELTEETDPNIRPEVNRLLREDQLNKSLHLNAKSADATNVLIDQLRSPEPNRETLKEALKIARNADGDNVKSAEDLVQFIIDMPTKDRIKYAESLSARLPSMKSIETTAENNFIIGLQDKTRNINTAEDYKKIENEILSRENLVNADKYINDAKEKLANVMSIQAKNIPLQHEELENVKNALGNIQYAKSLTAAERKAYDLYKQAHDIIPTSVNSAVSYRLDAITEANENLGHQVKIKGIFESVNKGINVGIQELEYLQDEIMGETIFLTADNIDDYPMMTDALKKGIMFPAFKSFFNSAVTSMDETTVEKAGNLFEEMTNVEVDSEGMSYKIDMLKANMKPETYAYYNAAVITARAEYTTPFLVISELRQYDGNLDQDVLADYNASTSGKLKNIKSIFDDRNVSPSFRNELSIAIKMQKARGVQITSETVDTIIDNYIETNNMGRDTNVIAAHIDGATAYPVMGFIRPTNFTANRMALTKALAQDDAYSPLLTGGGKFAQARELAKDLTLQNLPIMLRSLIQEFKGQYQARSELGDIELSREGHKTLSTDVFWKPDLMSFANGVPKYTAQYKDKNETYQDFIVNGEPWTLERVGNYTNEFRSVAHKEFISKLKSTQPKIRAEGYINYHATLEHMTYSEFKKDPEFNKLVTAYGNEEEVKITYAMQRLRWNAQSSNKFREQLSNLNIRDAALEYLKGVEGIGQK